MDATYDDDGTQGGEERGYSIVKTLFIFSSLYAVARTTNQTISIQVFIPRQRAIVYNSRMISTDVYRLVCEGCEPKNLSSYPKNQAAEISIHVHDEHED